MKRLKTAKRIVSIILALMLLPFGEGAMATSPSLVSLTASCETLTVPAGRVKTVTLTGIYDDGSEKDLTTKAKWASGNTSAAKVSKGNITGVKEGTAKVTASVGSETAEIDVTVTSPPVLTALRASSESLSVPKGRNKAVTLTALYDDGTSEDLTSKAKWISSDSSVAKVSKGKVSGVKEGTATLTATLGTQTLKIQVTVTPPPELVSLTVNVSSPSVIKGKSRALKLTASYDDGTTEDVTSKAVWTSEDVSIVKVSKGKITGVNVGKTTVSAAVGSVSRTVTVTVLPASTIPTLVSLTSSTYSVKLEKGKTQTFTLTATYDDGSTKSIKSGCVWGTTNAFVATCLNNKITAVGVGSVTVTVAYESERVEIDVLVTEPSSGNTSSSNVLSLTSISSINVSTGSSVSIAVVAVLKDGTTQPVTSLCKWKTSKDTIARVSNGTVTGVSPGSAVITATYSSKSVNIPVTVSATAQPLASFSANSSTLKVAKGKSKTVTVTGVYSDGTSSDLGSSCEWSSANSAVATVAKGKITGKSVGTTTVTAVYGSYSTTITVTVIPSLSVTELSAISALNVNVGKSITVAVTAAYSDDSTAVLKSCKWATSNSAVATVAKGKITGVAPGTATITASSGGASASIQVTVT